MNTCFHIYFTSFRYFSMIWLLFFFFDARLFLFRSHDHWITNLKGIYLRFYHLCGFDTIEMAMSHAAKVRVMKFFSWISTTSGRKKSKREKMANRIRFYALTCTVHAFAKPSNGVVWVQDVFVSCVKNHTENEYWSWMQNYL